ncbi:MAG: trypsin-like serine protease [Myxococcales bacterium]|nr:trypsin-like serine protease [Myxococcales bacterium]
MGCTLDLEDVDEPDDGEDVGEAAQPIAEGWVSYAPGLLRMDVPKDSGGYEKECSAFFIAPNMIATAAHCVYDQPANGASGVRDGMMWREIRARLVYKPSSSEVMCINEPCRGPQGETRFTTVRAWWINGYSIPSGAAYDVAVLTRVQGLDFPTRPADWGGAAPRSLSDGEDDFFRLLDGRTSGSTPLGVRGYGRFSDTGSDNEPRYGWLYLDWWGPSHVVSDAGRESRICKGDSGGPLFYQENVWSRGYVIGITSGMSGNEGPCPEAGDKMRWARAESKRWMYEAIMDWANRPGRTHCTRYPADLPGDGGYYRCW